MYLFYKKYNELEPLFVGWTDNEDVAKQYFKIRKNVYRHKKDATKEEVEDLRNNNYMLEIKIKSLTTKMDGHITKVNVAMTENEYNGVMMISDNITDILRQFVKIPSRIFSADIRKALDAIGYCMLERLNMEEATGEYFLMPANEFPPADQLYVFISTYIEENSIFKMFLYSKNII